MKRPIQWLAWAALGLTACSCSTIAYGQTQNMSRTRAEAGAYAKEPASKESFDYVVDRFADAQVLRYQVKGFDELTVKQKELVYYLYEAALCGRDMIFDQNYKHNLRVRRTLEAIIAHYPNKSEEAYQKLEAYAKRVFFSNGIHHHYSMKKFVPEITVAEFQAILMSVPPKFYPTLPGESAKTFIEFITPIIMDEKLDAKRVNLDASQDLIKTSAMNYYEGVTQKEVEEFYAKLINKKDQQPISYGLNSKLVKDKKGKIREEVYKVGGLYSNAITKVVYWLEKAVTVAENDKQKKALELLVKFYKTGSLKDFDAYNIAWVQDVDSRVDVVNGFIEVYGDPLGYRAAYESVVSIKDMEASRRIAAIGSNAQYFEDNSPILPEHKKKKVTGISAKVITAVVEAGDAAPTTPIGINLPNANWIRKDHGSKSVSLGNIVEAYDNSSAGGSIDEFAATPEEAGRAKKFGALAGILHTDMHEVIGHASGQILPGVGTPKETLKNYASALEEARADLVALYYILDPKLIEIGVMPSLEVGKAEYDSYIRNGMMLQLNRLDANEQLEEAHMRNRQLNASWVYERAAKTGAIVRYQRDGKTYFEIKDYMATREMFGQLLREIQRVISTGDFKAGQGLIEGYGVKVDEGLKMEVKNRFAKLNAAPYKGFVQPKLVPVFDNKKLVNVKVEYPKTFLEQMREYGERYSFLPHYDSEAANKASKK